MYCPSPGVPSTQPNGEHSQAGPVAAPVENDSSSSEKFWRLIGSPSKIRVPFASWTKTAPTPFAQHIPSPYESYNIKLTQTFPGTATLTVGWGPWIVYGPPDPYTVPSSPTNSQEVSAG